MAGYPTRSFGFLHLAGGLLLRGGSGAKGKGRQCGGVNSPGPLLFLAIRHRPCYKIPASGTSLSEAQCALIKALNRFFPKILRGSGAFAMALAPIWGRSGLSVV